MEEIIVDDTYKLIFPKKLIDLFKIKPKDRFDINVEENKIVLKKLKRKKDPLVELLESPAHADPTKIRQLNLKALDEELWTT
ncbi:MAG: AbrB/MazE/SpoVT family DNA-binding domain-containing protein [Candidatus Methanoperedens sp.]|nr:AbrB/MazE/SpoVT family DNA-binding domain-containing protein [Candidatus Methanoperedens sp.]